VVLVIHAAVETLTWKHSRGFNLSEEAPGQYRPLLGSLAPELALMRTGVYIFFVLSGYLLSRSFLASYMLGTPRPSISRFFRNRALRIIPAFWLVTTVYVLWDHATGAGGLLAVYGFAQNYHWVSSAEVLPQAWTLNVEVTYYIVVPIAALLALATIRRVRTAAKTRMWIVLAVLAAAYAVSLVLKHLAGNPVNNAYNIADYMFAIVPGLALATIEPFVAPRLRSSRWGRAAAWGLLCLCVALLGAFVSLPVSYHGIRLVLISLGCGALVGAPLILQWATGNCWRVLDNRVMQWLGQRTYGIYLVHLGLMGHLLVHIGNGHGDRTTFVLLLATAIPLTLLAADLLWRLVEQPALQRRLPWRQAEFGLKAAAGTSGASG
jgi:peptidoglycan/LPS O-acetylase OafA/YrhL